jgi:O-antigen/teichoic acid export membrane protein
MTSATLRDRTLLSATWAGATQMARQGAQFLLSIALARLLTPREFGTVGMVMVFVSFFQVFADFGLGSALIQRAGLEPRHQVAVFWSNVAVGLAVFVLLALAAPLIAAFYREPSLILLVRVASLQAVFSALSVVPRALLQKEMAFDRLARADLAAIALSGLAALALAVGGMGVWSLVAQYLVWSFFCMLFYWRACPWRLRGRFEWPALRELAGYGGRLAGFQTLNFWARNLDSVLIGRVLGAASVGLYSRAMNLMTMPLGQISSVVNQVLFPALSEIQNDLPRVREAYLRALRLIALLSFPMMTGLLVAARPVVLGLYGERWAGVVPLLQCLAVTGLAQSVESPVGLIYTSLGRTDVILKWAFYAVPVVLLSIIAGLWWGVIGVAISYSACYFLFLLYPSILISGRLIALSPWAWFRNLAGVLGCAALMGLVVAGVHMLLPKAWTPLAQLAVLVALGVAAYLGGLCIFRVRAWQELLGLINERRGRARKVA